MIKELIHDPIFLGQSSEPATGNDLQTAIDLMDTLVAHKDECVGMAANMIGVKKSIICFDNDGEYMTMLNPEIIKFETIFGADCFDIILGQQEGIPRKPSPEGAWMISDKFEVKPEECMYVGDTNTDMQTGKAAGMMTIGVTWGFRDREELEENHADVIIDHPTELLRVQELGK